MWWLDVETANTWNEPSSNAQVVQGALDFFKGPDLFVGGYRPPIPAWLNVPDSLANARSSCQTGSFTGGPIWLVQATSTSPQQNLDEDYAC